MDIKKEYGTSKKLEVEGVWVDVSDNARIKVARANNPKYKAEIERLTRPYKKQIRRGTMNGKKFDKIIAEATAKHILVDWEGLEEDGAILDYSHEEALRLLLEYPDFRDVVAETALDFQNYQEDVLEDSEKN